MRSTEGHHIPTQHLLPSWVPGITSVTRGRALPVWVEKMGSGMRVLGQFLLVVHAATSWVGYLERGTLPKGLQWAWGWSIVSCKLPFLVEITEAASPLEDPGQAFSFLWSQLDPSSPAQPQLRSLV